MSLYVAVITLGGVSHFKLREVIRPFGLDNWGNFTWTPTLLEGEFISRGTQCALNIYQESICVRGAIKSSRNEALSQFLLKEGASIFSAKYSLKILYNGCRFEITKSEDFKKDNYKPLPQITYRLGACSRQLFLPFKKWITLSSNSDADIILPAMAMVPHSTFSLFLTPDFLKFGSNSMEISINDSIPSHTGQAPLLPINYIELLETGYRIELTLNNSACSW